MEQQANHNNNIFQQFVELIISLTDNQQTLKQSEEILSRIIREQPDFFVNSCIAILKIPNFNINYKCMVSLLLRQRTSMTSNIMSKISPETLDHLKRELITIIMNEESRDLLRYYSNLLSTMCITLLANKASWMEALGFMANGWMKSENEIHRCLAAEFFSTLAQSEETFSYMNLQNQITELFMILIRDPSMKVRLNTLTGITHLNDEHQACFQPLLPCILEVVTKSLEDGEEDILQTVISKITEIVGMWMIPSLPSFLTIMFSILQNTHDDETKFSAAEFITSVCEAMPAFVRKNTQIIQQFVPHLFLMMSDIEDNNNWTLGQKYDKDDEASEVASQIIDRLSMVIRGKTFAPIMFNFIPQFLNHENWKYRHAGLMTISLMGEGSRKFLTEHLGNLIEFIIPKLRDPHQRVRFAACHALGQMCTDFCPQLQTNYHQYVMPAIIQSMDDENPRVQSHAVAVIINFCEAIDQSLLTPYLNALLEKLSNLLMHSNIQVVENTIIAISSVSDCVGSSFAPYYTLFMSRLNPILKQTQTPEFRNIGGLVFETMASIATAVGREIFMPDAPSLLESIFLIKSSITESNDPRIESINNSFIKLVQVLKDQFVPYFDRILPDLLTSISLTPELCIINLNTLENKENYHLLQIDDSSALAINSSEISEKRESCKNLSIFIDEMGSAFYPWIEKILPICKDLLAFQYCSDVRSNGAYVSSALLQSAVLYHTEHQSNDRSKIAAIFQFLFPSFYTAIMKESIAENIAPLLYALAEVIEYGKEGMTNEIAEKIAEIIKRSLGIFISKNTDYEEAINDPNFDPEDRESLDSDLDFVLDMLVNTSDIIGKMMDALHDAFLPSLLPYLPLFYSFLLEEGRPKCQQAAICLYDDLIRSGEKSKEACQNWLSLIIKHCKSENLNTVQAATFGVGCSAELFSPSSFFPFLSSSLQTLVDLLNHLNRKRKKDGKIAENAISAIGKIISYHHSSFLQINDFNFQLFNSQFNESLLSDPQCLLKTLLSFWFSTLPVSFDDIECVVIYTQLCRFIITYPEVMFGEKLANLPKILSIFGDIIGTSFVNAESSKLIKDILLQIQQQIPADVLQSILSSLSSPQISSIQKLLSSAN